MILKPVLCIFYWFVHLFSYLFAVLSNVLASLGNQGKSVGVGEKVWWKFLSTWLHGWKIPWVPTPTRPFPKGQANADSWLGTKKMKRTTYTMAIVLPYLSSLFTKVVRVHAWETFILIIINPVHFKILLKNQKLKHVKCMYGYFKDAFPQYQLELTTRI